MGQRTLYPKPDCSACGHWDVKVVNTYYTDDGEILRNRKCFMCEHSYWTLQAPERLFPEAWKLEFPKKFSKRRDTKKINIKKE